HVRGGVVVNHGSPNANTFFGPVMPNVAPMKIPLPQNTMPSAIDGPALHGPPLSNDHRTAPLLASMATILPTPGARLQPNTTSLAGLPAGPRAAADRILGGPQHGAGLSIERPPPARDGGAAVLQGPRKGSGATAGGRRAAVGGRHEDVVAVGRRAPLQAAGDAAGRDL